jgi:hypothetical protein
MYCTDDASVKTLGEGTDRVRCPETFKYYYYRWVAYGNQF